MDTIGAARGLGYNSRRVLEQLVDLPSGMTTRELSLRLKVNSSTMKNIVRRLVEWGYLTERGHYRKLLIWSGKPFEPSTACSRSSIGRARASRSTATDSGGLFEWWPLADAVVESAMRAMVRA